jgi:tRNA threonylcarbamoyladenosine biosynthesis protein TsaE
VTPPAHLTIVAAIPTHRDTVWTTEADTARGAQGLAAVLCAAPSPRGLDALITLHGGLGTGKTSFVRHLLRALGVDGRVRSPTYTLLETYRVDSPAGPIEISHFDFFRFDDPSEWVDAGLREPFESAGLKLVEWPEKGADLLPVADLALHLEVLPAGGSPDDDARRVRAEARTPRGLPWLAAWLGKARAVRP